MSETTETDRVLSPDVWRQVDAYTIDATAYLISASVSSRQTHGLASLFNAVEAGIAIPRGLSERADKSLIAFRDRLFAISNLAHTGDPEALELLNRWICSIKESQSKPPDQRIAEVLDECLRRWIQAFARSTQQKPSIDALEILRAHGASVERPPRDLKGKSSGKSGLELILQDDMVSLLEAWYGGERFSVANPFPRVYPEGSYKDLCSLTAALFREGPPSKCGAFLLSRMDECYVKPLQEAFAAGFRNLSTAQGKSRVKALCIMSRIVSAGASPSEGKEGKHAKWNALLTFRGGALNFRFPLELIQSDPFCIPALLRLLDSGLLDINEDENGTLLHHAALRGNKELVAELLNRGADTSLVFKFDSSLADGYQLAEIGLTAANIASQHGHHDVSALIASAAARQAIHRVAAAGTQARKNH